MSLSFQPHSINVIQKTCQRGGRESACLNATACFTTISRSPGQHSNSFGMTADLPSLIAIAASVTTRPCSQMVGMRIFQRSPSVPSACSLHRPVGVGHAGWQEVVCASAVWWQLPPADPDGSPSSHRTNCLLQTSLPCLRECWHTH